MGVITAEDELRLQHTLVIPIADAGRPASFSRHQSPSGTREWDVHRASGEGYDGGSQYRFLSNASEQKS